VPGESISVTFGGYKNVYYGGAVASNGTFACTVTVPKHARMGTVMVTARGSGGDSYSVPFTVM
jgi:hypothetical protein